MVVAPALEDVEHRCYWVSYLMPVDPVVTMLDVLLR